MQESESGLVWFITGTSSGFGRQFVASALARGDRVIATARSGSLPSIRSLEEGSDRRCRVLQLDVTASEDVIKEVANQALGFWGRVDVVVNNAGIGVAGTLEEGGMHCLMKQYETNLFGPLKVTNAFLPHMRKRRSGTIVFMGSRSGWQTDVTLRGFYASSKAALHALAETYAVELKQFNIRTFCFMPGAFRTPAIKVQTITESDGSTYRTISSEMLQSLVDIEDYSELKDFGTKRWATLARREPGNPVVGVETMVDFVRGEGCARAHLEKGKEPPVGIFLGKDCIENVEKKCRDVLESIDALREVAVNTDFKDDDREH